MVVSILLYGCTTWTLTKRLEKKLNGNYTRMLRASPGGNTPQSTCLPSRKLSKLDEPDMQDTAWEAGTSSVLLWSPTYGRAKAGRPARTEMNDREKWRERVRYIRASGTTWWWWWWWWYINHCRLLMSNPFLFI